MRCTIGAKTRDPNPKRKDRSLGEESHDAKRMKGDLFDGEEDFVINDNIDSVKGNSAAKSVI